MKKKKNLEKENQKIQEELIEEIKKTKQNKTKQKIREDQMLNKTESLKQK